MIFQKIPHFLCFEAKFSWPVAWIDFPQRIANPLSWSAFPPKLTCLWKSVNERCCCILEEAHKVKEPVLFPHILSHLNEELRGCYTEEMDLRDPGREGVGGLLCLKLTGNLGASVFPWKLSTKFSILVDQVRMYWGSREDNAVVYSLGNFTSLCFVLLLEFFIFQCLLTKGIWSFRVTEATSDHVILISFHF